MIKVGTILYAIYPDADDEGKPCMEEWHVRTIRGGKITAIWCNRNTWGKRSKRNGDFGWLDPLPGFYRRTWRIGAKLPWGLFTTKRQAINAELKGSGKTIPDDFDNPANYDRWIASLKRMRP